MPSRERRPAQARTPQRSPSPQVAPEQGVASATPATQGPDSSPAVVPPTTRITLDCVMFPGMETAALADVLEARAIFAQHGLQIDLGTFEIVPAEDLPRYEEQSFDGREYSPVANIGSMPDYDTAGNVTRQGTVNDGMRALLTRIPRSDDRLLAVWVDTLFQSGNAYALFAEEFTNLTHDAVVLSASSEPDVLAHELLHVLTRAGHEDLQGNTNHDVPVSNLAYPNPTRGDEQRGTDLTPEQLARLHASPYAQAVTP